MQRRNFLRQAGLVSAAAVLGSRPAFAAAAPLPAGLQLYTLRDYIGKDVPGVLAKVARAGYKEVETYGYSQAGGFWGLTSAQFKAALAASGLTTSSGHYDLDSFLRTGSPEALLTYIEAAKACGQTYLVVPYIN